MYKNKYLVMICTIILYLVWYNEPCLAAPAKEQSGKNVFSLTADAAVLIDAHTGQVLYEKNSEKKRPPASTTKIMTTILALEYGNPADIITISKKAGETGQATLHLDPGEKIRLGNLIEGALIKSGNDACVAISEYVAGNEPTFINMMNAKAKIMGAYNTNFTNTNGLPDSRHYSTAYDLAMMARYGMKLPKFAEITKTKEAAIEFVEPDTELQVRNTNKLLWMYEFADGVKTGTTNAAGKCLVSSATKQGRKLIAVVLDSPARFTDSIKLLEYGFSAYTNLQVARAGTVFSKVAVVGGKEPCVEAIFAEDVDFLTPIKNVELVQQKVIWHSEHTAPIKRGERLGELQYWLQGRQVGQVALVAGSTLDKQTLYKQLRTIVDKYKVDKTE